MTDVLQGVGGRIPSSDLLLQWREDYARGRYTDVAAAWGEVCVPRPRPDLLDDPRVIEAVGWSLALTKQWDAYLDFRSEALRHATREPSKQLLLVLDAWHAIHEARYDTALFLVRQARGGALSDTSPRVLSHAFKVEGVALFRMGRYDESEDLMQRALDLFRLTEETLNVAHCATNLGLILNARGEIRAAREKLQHAIAKLVEADAAEERLALAHANLAIVEVHLGNVEAATGLYREALQTFESLDLCSERVTALNGLGHCARLRGEFESARKFHSQALALSSALPRQEGLCHEFLGQICFDLGEVVESERHYRKALETAASISPDGDLMVEVCWHLGELLATQGRLEEALEFVERAENLCDASGDRRELGCVQRARARILAGEGRTEEAQSLFQAATETLEHSGRMFEAALTDLARGETAQPTDVGRIESLERAAAGLASIAEGSRWCQRVEVLLQKDPSVTATGAPALYGFLTRDPDLVELLEDIPQMARTSYPVLLEGESGTGKELLARALHEASRRKGAFVAVNCAALPRDLFESELFGHTRGAFSGALADKPGLLEQAHQGTLLLDEVGEMPPELQAKLLRVLDNARTRRVGALREQTVDVKIVAATNRPLERSVESGRFRRDLFHRLAVHQLHIKPLRERPDDVELLARHFAHELDAMWTLPSESLLDLRARTWPGNVRELRNVLIRSVMQRHSARHRRPVRSQAPSTAARSVSTSRTLRAVRAENDRRVIEATLVETAGNVTAAARVLGMHVTTLRRRMRRLGVRRPA